MRVFSTLPVMLAGLLLALGSTTAHATEYFPPPCQDPLPPEWFACPEPYVQLVPVRHDDSFSSAWYCRQTDHGLGALRDGGCLGSSGLTMFPDWSVPTETLADANDVSLRAEVEKHVVDPCFLDAARRNRIDGVSDQEMIDLLKAMQSDAVDTIMTSLLPLVRDIETMEGRSAVYTFGRMACIQGARGGSG